MLILAALMASMVGAQRRFRRPLLAGVALALAASAVTWVVAQTVLGSLARYGEKLEAIVSLVAIGVLLLILNWFYHRVYWQENLQACTGARSGSWRGAALALVRPGARARRARLLERLPRGVRDRALPAGADARGGRRRPCCRASRSASRGGSRSARSSIALERKLPHKKMLIATGLLITWVLVVLVGTTVQTMQAVGWLPVTPIEGLELPYWTGAWLGVLPDLGGPPAPGRRRSSSCSAATSRRRRSARADARGSCLPRSPRSLRFPRSLGPLRP